MDFDDVVRKRRMIRRFAPDAIPASSLDDVIRAGTRAPSAGFAQGVDLIVLTSETARATSGMRPQIARGATGEKAARVACWRAGDRDSGCGPRRIRRSL